jgi:hypothetical protein
VTRAPAAALALLVAVGCTPADGPMMAPGEDCLRCHGRGEADDEDGPTWTVAGTVYPSETTEDPGAGVRGATISVRDANGKSFDLRSNRAGNFYSAEPLAFPIEVAVNGRGGHRQPTPLADGSCNRCHRPGVEGRLPAN